MEKSVRATFESLNDMKLAGKAIKRQGVIDLRLDGQICSALPDFVRFSVEPPGQLAKI